MSLIALSHHAVSFLTVPVAESAGSGTGWGRRPDKPAYRNREVGGAVGDCFGGIHRRGSRRRRQDLLQSPIESSWRPDIDG